MLLRLNSLFFLSVAVLHFSEASRAKRQLSIDDLISRALNLVRPIFDTSQPLQSDAIMKPQTTMDDVRGSSILGARQASPLDNLPFCKGSSRICQFISCSAENFKKDAAFGNLQLAAQVLADPKLRKAVSSNPEAIDLVCQEQGMDDAQCKLFSKGFQLIDRFITTIEKPSAEKKMEKPERMQERSSSERDRTQTMMADDVPIPISKDGELEPADYDDLDMLPPAPSASISSSPAHRALGSKTWSSQPDGGPQLLEVRNDLVASLTPPPLWPTFAPFAPPTPPPAPPLAFPTVPSLILPPFKMPSFNKNIFFPVDKYLFGPPTKTFRMRRGAIEVREKRDTEYYDQLTGHSEPKSSSSRPAGRSNDYYDEVDETVSKAPQKESALRNCVNMLGLGA